MIKPSFGVIVGRFQVHELHEGHKELFRQVKARHNRVIVFVGVSPVRGSQRNPLDFETRSKMINKSFPDFTVLPLDDTMTDEQWSKNLDTSIRSVADYNAEVVLYGGRDSFVPHYTTGKYKPVELPIDPSIMKVKGEDIRAKLTDTVMENADFRAGQIYAAMNRPKRVVTTVDIAIYHKGASFEFLMGRKEGEPAWRFIGGHAEPTTESFERDAKNETREETGVELISLEYIGSCIVPDWRYVEEEDKIKTLVFAGLAASLSAKAADDIAYVKWFKSEVLDEDGFVDTHKPLFRIVKKYFTKEFGTEFKNETTEETNQEDSKTSSTTAKSTSKHR
jgi:bifunctional NMN adenylyltransferase/nudix hydrolase